MAELAVTKMGTVWYGNHASRNTTTLADGSSKKDCFAFSEHKWDVNVDPVETCVARGKGFVIPAAFASPSGAGWRCLSS